VEFTALQSGNDAVDLSFNYYGAIFQGAALASIFRKGPSNLDVNLGYSHELWNGGPDLRLSGSGYSFESGTRVYGWKAGAEVKSRDGRFSLKYETAADRLNETYHSVGAFLNVGFETEKLFRGENPLAPPRPIFASPRNPEKLLTEKVKRNWHQPSQAVVARAFATAAGSSSTPPYFLVEVSPISGDPDNGRPPCEYIQFDETTGVMGWDGSFGGSCISANYTVRLMGDTSGLSFPLTVTMTPVITGGFSIFVRETSPLGFNQPESATFSSAGQILTIPPDGLSGPPENAAPGGSRATPGVIGMILFEATGVSTLTVTVQRTGT
jgi:hypothetical protein